MSIVWLVDIMANRFILRSGSSAVEQEPFKLLVAGSNPARITKLSILISLNLFHPQMILSDIIFKSEGLLWVVEKRDNIRFGGDTRGSIHHAACPKEEIRVRLDLNEASNELFCDSCGFKKKLERSYEELRQLVNKRYHGWLLSSAEVKSLDLLATSVTDNNEDDNFWIRAKLGEKDGKRQAVVWIGDKRNKSGEKIQLLIDIEDEQLRFDKTDKNPSELISAVKVVLKDSVTERNST